MEALSVVGVITAILAAVYYMMGRARADGIIGQLEIKPKAKEIEDQKEIARLEQEIANAKIDYRAARDLYNKRVSDGQRPSDVPDSADGLHSGPK